MTILQFNYVFIAHFGPLDFGVTNKFPFFQVRDSAEVIFQQLLSLDPTGIALQ